MSIGGRKKTGAGSVDTRQVSGRTLRAAPKTADVEKRAKPAAIATKRKGGAIEGESVFAELSPTLTPNQSNAVLRTAIIISVVFHLALLAIKVTNPDAFDEFFQRSSLEVVLINAQTNEAPTNAQLRVQHNYAGGGNLDDPNAYASSPNMHSEEFSVGDSFEESIAQQNAAREETMRTLDQVKSQYANLPPIDPSWGENDNRRLAEEERRRQLSQAIAAIEQRIREENARPRRMYIGPAARSDAQAMYFDTIRQKIELKGTESFPQYAGLPLYGSLLMEVIVNPQGQLVEATVIETSGKAVLDRQAQAIARSAGPFVAAPAELLKVERNVEFVFIMRFNFLNEGRLDMELMERVPQPSRQ